MSKSLLKGTVRQFVNSNTILLKGPIKDGVPLEKTLILEGIIGPNKGAEGWLECWLYLNTTFQDKKIEFRISKTIAKKDYGQAFFENQDLASLILEKGFAKIDTDKDFHDQYHTSSEKAQKDQLGLYGKLQKINFDLLEQKDIMQDSYNKPLSAIVQEINATHMVVFLKSINRFCKLTFQEIMLNFVSTTNTLQMQAFIEEKIKFNTSVNVTLLSFDSQLHHFTSKIEVRDFDFSLALLEEGFARLNTQQISHIAPQRIQKLKDAVQLAVSNNKRIYNHQQKENQVQLPSQYIAKIVEIHSADSLTIENLKNGKNQRIFLPNVKGGNKQELALQFRGKEFLRENFIGKIVQVEEEFSKKVQVKIHDSEQMETKIMHFATIRYNNQNIGALIIGEGLAFYNGPRGEEEFSKYIKELSEAQEEAQKEFKGFHNKKFHDKLPKYNDLTNINFAKAKEHLEFIKSDNKKPGVIELVISSTKFKVRLEKELIHIIVVLAGIKPLVNDPNQPELAQISNQALQFSKNSILQRDVEILFEGVQKNGTFLATVFVNKRNYGSTLIEEGFAYTDEQRANKYQQDYIDSEKIAKKGKKGIWKLNFQVHLVQNVDEKLEKIDFTKNLKLVEISPNNIIYLQDENSKDLKLINQEIQASIISLKRLQSPIQNGTYCIALYDQDGQHYRGIIQKKLSDSKYTVKFIDFGTIYNVDIENLQLMPPTLKGIPSQAYQCKLAFLTYQHNENDMTEQVQELLWNQIDQTFKVKFCLKENDIYHVILFKANQESLNMQILKSSYAKLVDFGYIQENLKGTFQSIDNENQQKKKGIYTEKDEGAMFQLNFILNLG